MTLKHHRREYFVTHPDPHRNGPIVVTLADRGIVVQWAGADGAPLLCLSPADLMTVARIERAESDLQWLREEAEQAVAAIKESRDELRSMIRAVRGAAQ